MHWLSLRLVTVLTIKDDGLLLKLMAAYYWWNTIASLGCVHLTDQTLWMSVICSCPSRVLRLVVLVTIHHNSILLLQLLHLLRISNLVLRLNDPRMKRFNIIIRLHDLRFLNAIHPGSRFVKPWSRSPLFGLLYLLLMRWKLLKDSVNIILFSIDIYPIFFIFFKSLITLLK